MQECKYLGVTFNESGLGKAKQEKETKALQWWGRLNSAAKRRVNKYEVVRGLWKSVAVPSIMYGVDQIEKYGS